MKLREFVTNTLPRIRSKRRKKSQNSTSDAATKDKNDNDIVKNYLATDEHYEIRRANGNSPNRNNTACVNLNNKTVDYTPVVYRRRMQGMEKYRIDTIRPNAQSVNGDCSTCGDYSKLTHKYPRRSQIRTNPWCAQTPKRTGMQTSVTSLSPPSPNSLSSSFMSSGSTSAETSDASVSNGSDVSFHADDGYGTLRSYFIPRSNVDHSWRYDRKLASRDSCLDKDENSGENGENTTQDHRHRRDHFGGQTARFNYEEVLNDLLESDELKTSDSQISIDELIADGNDSFERFTTLRETSFSDAYKSVDGFVDQSTIGESDVNGRDRAGELIYTAQRGEYVEVVSGGYTTNGRIGLNHYQSTRNTDGKNADREILGGGPNLQELLSYISPYETEVKNSCCRNRIEDAQITETAFDDSDQVDRSPGKVLSRNPVTDTLAAKVARLREEKLVVRQKIWESQEEERIRMRDTRSLRRKMSLFRKKVLLKTLEELKARLEAQSVRLQKSYDAILSIQRQFPR